MKHRMWLSMLCGTSIFLASTLFLHQIQAQTDGTRYVAVAGDCGGAGPCYTSVQAAVDAAQPGDEILIASGVYSDTHARPAPPTYVPSRAITQVVYITKPLALRGGYTTTTWTDADPDVNPTVLDAKGQGRGILIAGDIDVTLAGLHVTNGDPSGLGGFATATSADDVGGGIYVLSAALTLWDDTISSNVADRAGGMFVTSGRVTMWDSWIEDNTVPTEFQPSQGAGVYLADSDAVLVGNTFQGNQSAGGEGGAVYAVDSTVVLSGNVFRANRADSGGGLMLRSGDYTLSNNLFDDNMALTGTGGAFQVAGSAATIRDNWLQNHRALFGGGIAISDSDVVLARNGIIDNSAIAGGGIHLRDSRVTLTNNVIRGNSAGATGSGMLLEHSQAHLLHNTIVDNTGLSDATGLYLETGSPGSNQGPQGELGSRAWLTNTIVMSQTVGIYASAESQAMVNGVLWLGNGMNTVGAGAIAVTNEHTGDPAFAADGYHLTAGSAAIDRGVIAGVFMDIDREPRFSEPDLGADEFITFTIRRTRLPLLLR
jgi:hypothetical protein